jgi:hypothetical protein
MIAVKIPCLVGKKEFHVGHSRRCNTSYTALVLGSMAGVWEPVFHSIDRTVIKFTY